MKVAILTPVVLSDDAVGNDVMGMYYALKAEGHEVAVFADHSAGIQAYPTREVPHFCDNRDSCVIYHYSIGWPGGLELVEAAKGRKILKYHNVTPPEFFAPISVAYADACRAGREGILGAAHMAFDLFLGDSAYNMQELVDAGAPVERAGVVPPFHHISSMVSVDADLSFLERFREGFNILMVGRIAPNKGHPALVKAFADFRHRYCASARLLIIGKLDPRLSAYDDQIRSTIDKTGVADSVFMLGGVSLQTLKAAYLCADVFMTMSEHEGFCVPVVEAMSMGVPVLGYGSSAVPETVGSGGLVWSETDLTFYSESLRELAAERDLRLSLGASGKGRFNDVFREDRIKSTFLEQFARAVHA